MHKKGSLIGLLSGFFWGLDSVVLGIALIYPIMITMGVNASLVTTFIHDSISFIILILILLKFKKLNEFKRIIKSKSGITIMIAALLGGPIGMGGYILSINYLGSTLASSISAIYPAVGVFLAYIFLKQKIKIHSIFGLFIAILAIILMGLSPDIQVNNLTLGLAFAMLSVFGWGSEAVIINVALKENVSSEVALAIRQLVSTVSYGLIVMPLIGYHNFQMTISNSSIFAIVFVSGVIGTLSYLSYYKSIDLIGATQAMGLNITYPAWALFFQYLLLGEFEIKLFVLSIFIMIGSILSNDKPKEVLEIFKFNIKQG